MRRYSSLPDFVRIKRKRNQDSLQALILEGRKSKRAKDELYVFKLQRTDDSIVQLSTDGDKTLPLLQELDDINSNTFMLPKQEPKEEDQLPDELNEMLNSVLNIEQPSTEEERQIKKRKRKQQNGPGESSTLRSGQTVDLEYVYDVYYRDKAVHESWEKDRIGYIKFEEDLNGTFEDTDSINALTDDEDSNAEDFYQNDYPEDEDAHSILSGEGEGEDEDEDEDAFLDENIHKLEAIKDAAREEDEYDEIYDQFFDDEGNGPQNFLDQLGHEPDDEDDDDDINDSGYEESDYERQNFFPGEEDDELAKHRDRIFGRLQRMINE